MEAKKYPSQEHPKFMLRLPVALKEWVRAQAENNGSSQNSEIVRAVRERQARVAKEVIA
jgi:predicted HicB family RNase H-like nuclease